MGDSPGRDAPPAAVAPVPALAFFVGYVLLAAVAQEFAVSVGADVSVWYAPPGLFVAVACWRSLRYWPVAIAAEFAVSIWVYDVAGAMGWPRTLLNAVVVTGAYALGVVVIQRSRSDLAMGRRRDLGVFVLATFLVAAPLAALAGTAMQRSAGIDDPVGNVRAVTSWWVGDAIGMLVVAPITYHLLTTDLRWSARRLVARLDPFRIGEAALVLGLPFITFVVAEDPYRFLYVPLLPVVLVAVRHGSSVATWAVSGVVLATTLAATGAGGTIGRYDLQLLLLVLALTGLSLGIVETMRTDARIREHELSALLEASPDLVAIVDETSRLRWVNPAGRRLLGLPSVAEVEDLAGTAIPLLLEGGLDGGAVGVALERGSWRGTARLRRPSGEELRLSQLLVALPGDNGRRVGIVARDVTDLHRVTDQLTRMSFIDELTGLGNRARFLERLAFALGSKDVGNHGVVLLDVDRFASINDHLGHEAGDVVLQCVAHRLADAVRSGELLVRVANDRFGVLLEHIPDPFSAAGVADRLRIAAAGRVETDHGDAVVTVSAGVVVGETGEDPDVVLRRADLALQRAKQAGGSMTSPYDAKLSQRLTHRIRIEELLREHLENGGWPMRYQPIVDLGSGAIVACEALLEPLAPPLDVVGVAEELGLIGQLGVQVLEASVRQAVEWRRRLPELRIGVNVSAHQLLDRGFAEKVDHVLRREGLPASALVLEITETAFTEDRPEALVGASVLQGMGVKISVDDFGTGFSTLARLRSLPIDELKLDRTFVADLGRLPGAEAIVAAVVALGAARGLDVVAEGVEEEGQRLCLLELGCVHGQGWLFARPMAPASFEQWLDGR